jgi:hypothetical protein
MAALGMVLLQPQRDLEEAAAAQAQTQAGVAEAGGDGRVGRLFLIGHGCRLRPRYMSQSVLPFGAKAW